jgi:hypothetical protein
VKRHSSTASEGFKSSLHMISGIKVLLGYHLSFGSLLYIAKDKRDIKDPRLDPRAQATVYLGRSVLEGRKCFKGYSFNFKNKGHRGRIMYNPHTYSNPTYFPLLNTGEDRVVSLSGATYMSGKEELDREIPIPPEIEDWANVTEMQYKDHILDDQQGLDDSQYVSENGISVDKSTPLENYIVEYNGAQDQ